MSDIASVSLERPLADVAVELGESFAEFGFAVVRDHGIPDDLVARAQAASEAFFALPDETKRAYKIEGIAGARGYTPFGQEQAKDAEVFDLASPPDRSHPKMAWLVNGFRAFPAHGDAPREGYRPMDRPPQPVVTDGKRAPAVPTNSREAVVLEYLKGMREAVSDQRDVVLGYLGDGLISESHSKVDNFHAGVSICTSQNFNASVMSIKSRFSHNYSYFLIH